VKEQVMKCGLFSLAGALNLRKFYGLSLAALLFEVALSFDRVANRFNSFGRVWKELAQL
jgi:hypothetical protein